MEQETVPLYFPPVACLQHISNWQHHFLCSRRSTEHIYIGHYLYSFHAHGTRFSSLSVRTKAPEGNRQLEWENLTNSNIPIDQVIEEA